MIDLSGAKVGDKYDATGIGELIVLAASKNEVCFSFFDGLKFIVTDIHGQDDDGLQIVTSKIDSRPWLKYMPDAGVFKDEFRWLACDEDGEWYAYYGKPGIKRHQWSCGGACFGFDLIKMPTLTGDQWEDSLISTDELREWQGVNK